MRLVDDLATIPDISSKRMFGGVGIFSETRMFAIVDSGGRVFLKADDSTKASFEQAGSEKHGRMPYWTVPEAVRTDPDQTVRWAERAVEVAKAR